MKKFVLLALCLPLLTGCADQYEKGYKDGYTRRPRRSTNKDYESGYKQGGFKFLLEARQP